MHFEDKVVWITGASSGLGEALAHAFHREGADVVLSARRQQALERVAGEMTEGPGERLVMPLDLTDPASLEAAARRVLVRFGHIDILVNNAGRTMRATAENAEMSVFRELMEVNFFGPLALGKLVLPSMVERGRGRIVVISSIAAKYATPFRSGYTASKAAQEGVFDAIRAEAWSKNIAVTTVVLGAVRTNISVNAANADGSNYGRMNKLQAEGMDPDEAARRVLDAVAGGRDEVMIAPLRQRWEVWRERFLPRYSRRAVRLTRSKG